MSQSSPQEAGPLRVLLIESQETNREVMRGLAVELDDVELAGWASDPQKGLFMVPREQPDLVVLELPEESATALEVAGRLSAAFPSVQILGSSDGLNSDLLRQAMRAGIRDLVERPFDAADLGQALRNARELQLERLDGQFEMAETIAFLGAGGGLGTTTLAVNTAVLLARQQASRVLLADLDLGGGDVAAFLNLDDPAMTFLDLLSHGQEHHSLPGMLATHRSGLHALAGPDRLEDLEAVRSDELNHVVGLCRNAFRLIVVDAGHQVNGTSLSLLDRANQIHLVTQLSLPSLQGAARRLDLFARLGYPSDRCSVILNRVHKHAHISVAEAERMLGTTIEYQVGSDYKAALAAIDSGVPLVEERRGRRLTRMIEPIARRHLLGLEGQQSPEPAASSPAESRSGR